METTQRVSVDGLRELGAALKGLRVEVAMKLARKATARAARLVKKQAVENIQSSPSVHTGSLMQAVIVKRAPKSETSLTSEHFVTVRGRGKPTKKEDGGDAKKAVARAPHARFVEFGTVNMPAEPFLQPAFDAKKNEAIKAMADSLKRGIKRALKPPKRLK